jgi:tetratricopeptide (TPR) repeat protein
MMGTIKRALLAAGLAALGCAQPASAEWIEATSQHFVVYANGDPGVIRRQAEQLERFDSLLRYFHSIPAREEDSSNKLTVYVVGSDDAVAKLFGAGGSNIAGFYQGRASGSVAFTPARGPGDSGVGALQPQIVLFHEYAHHVMLGATAMALPAWYGEGYAEFLSTARFDKDVVWVGAPALHRAYSLLMETGLSAEQLFTIDRARMSENQIISLYARGWLLTHYLTFDPERRKQLAAYLKALNDGKPGVEAARAAFGDLKALNKALAAYLGKSRLPAYKIPLERLPTPTVTLRPLRPGEKAMMPLRMRSDRGVDRTTAQPILARAIPIGERYPDDSVVQGWLAEMALDAGNNDLAEAAADRALAIDPKSSQALIYKAQVHLRRAMAAKASDPAVWKEARSWLLKANRLDSNDAYALELYHASFGMAHAEATANAKAALTRAYELVPQDPGVAYAYATQAMIDGKLDEARMALRPLAYSAHSGPDNPAARMLAQLNAGKSGPAALAAMEAEAKKP